jgi:type 1 glutamine amidotransferase
MRVRGFSIAVCVVAATFCTLLMAEPQQVQSPPMQPPAAAPPSVPLRVFIYSGLKTHGPGQHDYPQFLADWSKMLTERGAIVDGALHFPSARELANVDVMVIYKGDAGYVGIEDRATLDGFLRRGGGLVSLHDSLCGDDPQWLASILGGAKKHGEVNYTLDAEVSYTIADPSSPIMQGLSNFTIADEAFFLMTWSQSPGIHVLATAPMAATPSAGTHKGEVVPQIWTYERQLAPAPTGQPYRAFVWMQGHNYVNFTNPQVQPMLLRGIAWAARRPVDALMTVVRPARGRSNNAR